ncbi:MAG: hypothetical protein AAF411_27485 [Myxococcota bacterium]
MKNVREYVCLLLLAACGSDAGCPTGFTRVGTVCIEAPDAAMPDMGVEDAPTDAADAADAAEEQLACEPMSADCDDDGTCETTLATRSACLACDDACEFGEACRDTGCAEPDVSLRGFPFFPLQLAVMNDGDMVAAGIFTAPTDFGDGEVSPLGETDAALVRYAPNGDVRWAKTYGGAGLNVVFSALATNGTDLFVGIALDGDMSFDGVTAAGPERPAVGRWSGSGDAAWVETGPPGTSTIPAIAVNDEGVFAFEQGDTSHRILRRRLDSGDAFAAPLTLALGELNGLARPWIEPVVGDDFALSVVVEAGADFGEGAVAEGGGFVARFTDGSLAWVHAATGDVGQVGRLPDGFVVASAIATDDGDIEVITGTVVAQGGTPRRRHYRL